MRVTVSPHSTGAFPPGDARRYSREAFLFASLVLLVLAFGFTAFVSRMYHKQVHTLADFWFLKGEASYRSRDATAAVINYRNALVYSPNNPQFQFHLAQALAATGRGDEARSYLLNLLSESPGSGEINLELARIAARQNSMPESLRYYHGAIYGVWDTDPISVRWQVRRELSEYLLDHGAANQAVAEIIQLVDNTSPGDIERLKIAGGLLSRARHWSRALSAFRSVLAADTTNADALMGAGAAAFELGQYSQAAEYLDRLPREQATDSKVAEMAEASRQVLARDPFVAGLPADRVARRAATALSLAQARLEECAGRLQESLPISPPATLVEKALAENHAMQKEWSQRNLLLHPERTDAAMSLVFNMENLAAKECDSPEGADRALWLLGRSRGAIP
jgi:tetratricopeptide (TPR) repeat protein